MKPPETQTQPLEVKRGPGRPKKQPTAVIPEPSTEIVLPEPAPTVLDSGFDEQPSESTPPAEVAATIEPTAAETEVRMQQVSITLGEIYASIDAAKPEWLNSILAKLITKGLRDGAWSNADDMLLYAKTIASKPINKKS